MPSTKDFSVYTVKHIFMFKFLNFIYFLFIYSHVHTLGHFSTLFPSPTFLPLPPQFQAGLFSLITDFVEEKT
jgi:hypothetical protein